MSSFSSLNNDGQKNENLVKITRFGVKSHKSDLLVLMTGVQI